LTTSRPTRAFMGAGTLLLSSASSKTAMARPSSSRSVRACRWWASHPRPTVPFAAWAATTAWSPTRTWSSSPPIPPAWHRLCRSVALRQRIHQHCTQLAYSCAVGASHVGDLGGAGQRCPARARSCFAPAQVKKRTQGSGACRA
jgi:hypothetical protein